MAGGLAAALWAAQQPADKRAFGSGYDDVELLGKLVTRGDAWPAAGLALHVANGAAFGATYAQLRPLPARSAGGAAPSAWPWPSTSPCGRSAALSDRYHPARKELTPAGGQPPRLRPGHLAPPAVRRWCWRARAPAERRRRGRAARGPRVLERPREHRAGRRRGRVLDSIDRAGVAQLVEQRSCNERRPSVRVRPPALRRLSGQTRCAPPPKRPAQAEAAAWDAGEQDQDRGDDADDRRSR